MAKCLAEPSLPFPEGRYGDAVFDIGRARGFLPAQDPSPVLPPSFQPLQNLLDRMPVWLDGGTRGILGAEGRIVDEVAALPNLLREVEALVADKSAENGRALQVVFRGYAFLASAFLLEKAFYGQTPDGMYGKARRVLPAQVAQPLACAALALNQHPWLDYHYGYALGNYVRIHPSKGYGWKNLKMAVRFTGTKDENGFVMLHVTINAKSGALLGAISDTLLGARRGDNALLMSGLNAALDTLRDMNLLRREMWKASRPDHYNDFRVFIMGAHGNDAIFGDGVVYEGVARFGGVPQAPRGQTGAQDDVIPTCDIFGGVTRFYPDNQLTNYLMDLRRYRPLVIQAFFQGLEDEMEGSGLRGVLASHPAASALMLAFLEQVYAFRAGHWQFVLRYIMMATRHSVATGGTPITSWLPNQMGAVLDAMQALLDVLNADMGGSSAAEACGGGGAQEHTAVTDDGFVLHALAPPTPDRGGHHDHPTTHESSQVTTAPASAPAGKAKALPVAAHAPARHRPRDDLPPYHARLVDRIEGEMATRRSVLAAQVAALGRPDYDPAQVLGMEPPSERDDVGRDSHVHGPHNGGDAHAHGDNAGTCHHAAHHHATAAMAALACGPAAPAQHGAHHHHHQHADGGQATGHPGDHHDKHGFPMESPGKVGGHVAKRQHPCSG